MYPTITEQVEKLRVRQGTGPIVFVGVKSMKIYCHPTCKARPKPQNVMVFQSRHEAERLGFRPCKACFSSLPQGIWDDHRAFIAIQPPRDFRFAVNLLYLNRAQDECMHVVKNEMVYKVLQLDGLELLIEISEMDDGRLRIRFVNQIPPKKSTRVAAAAYVWDWFDLDTELDDFYQTGLRDPVLKSAVQDLRGLRLIGVPDLFESLCWTIIGQQINLPFAYVLKKRLVELCGHAVSYEDSTYWTFPSPENVAQLSVNILRGLQFTARKAEYLIDIARSMASGELSRAKLLRLNGFNSIHQLLQGIRGIGPWSASYVLMRHFRDPSAFPIEDVGLHNAVKNTMGLERKPSRNELNELANEWGQWKAYATFYLWMTLFPSSSSDKIQLAEK